MAEVDLDLDTNSDHVELEEAGWFGGPGGGCWNDGTAVDARRRNQTAEAYLGKVLLEKWKWKGFRWTETCAGFQSVNS